jgi:hypothetical protein
VFSDELAKPASLALTQQQYKRSYFGTSSYIPALFGLYIASHVVRQVVEPGYQLPKPAASSVGSKSSSGGKAKRKTGKKQGKAGGSSSSSSDSQYGDSTTGSYNSGNGLGIADSSSASTGNSTASMGSSTCSDVSAAAAADPSDTYRDQVSTGFQSAVQTLSSSRLSAPAQGSQLSPQSQQPVAAAAGSPLHRQLFGSYEQCQGVGMGLDGEGL